MTFALILASVFLPLSLSLLPISAHFCPSSLPGYANEVGEAFRAMVPTSVVWLSYGVATSYVVADAVDKGKKASAAWTSESGRTTKVAVAVVDTFIWQALASVAIPGFTINRLCALSLYALSRTTRWPLAARKWTTTALGLMAIPVIIHPIDRYSPKDSPAPHSVTLGDPEGRPCRSHPCGSP
uniref:Mitochondrial fission process protein 1 n=1 Tax=Monodelphis domestica TaxID=13616 RepID=A0A5F8G208_MONDO